MNSKIFSDFYRKNSPKLVVSSLLFIIAIFLLFFIISEVVIQKEEYLDFLIFKIFSQYFIRNGLTDLMYVITQLSSISFMTIVSPFLLVPLLVFKNYRKAIFAFATGVGGLLLIVGLKTFFARPRPLYPLLYKEETFSFPSGHATFSFIFYGTLAYFIWLSNLPKAWKYVGINFLILLSFTIGLSRIYLRVHYPSDVLAGFCIGYSWLFLMIFSFRKWYSLH